MSELRKELILGNDRKINPNLHNKESICRLASNFIDEGDIIFVDSGATLALIPKYIAEISVLTVITTSLTVVSKLLGFSNIRLSLIGGEINDEQQATYGTVAKNNIQTYHANKAFVGADGISIKKGISSYDDNKGDMTRMMMENADEVFLLCDSSKIEKNSFQTFASINDIHHLITDDRITPEQVKMYRDFGVDVIIATKENNDIVQNRSNVKIIKNHNHEREVITCCN